MSGNSAEISQSPQQNIWYYLMTIPVAAILLFINRLETENHGQRKDDDPQWDQQKPLHFHFYPWVATLRTATAVYAVLWRNHVVIQIYIGNTCNLDPHLYQHLKLADFDREGKTHVGVHIEPVVSRRHAKETNLIARYAPVLNLTKVGFLACDQYK